MHAKFKKHTAKIVGVAFTKPALCNPDQPAHLCSLASAFVFYYLESTVVKLAPCKLSMFQLVSVAEQAGLNMRLSGTPKTGFLMMRPVFCKFGNFREDFIFVKLHICEVS